jgi:excinuclease UvrABC helicase subunit UvrB
MRGPGMRGSGMRWMGDGRGERYLEEILESTSVADMQSSRVAKSAERERERIKKAAEPIAKYLTPAQRKEMIDQMFVEMKNAARDLDFERAAELRDEITRLQALNDA